MAPFLERDLEHFERSSYIHIYIYIYIDTQTHTQKSTHIHTHIYIIDKEKQNIHMMCFIYPYVSVKKTIIQAVLYCLQLKFEKNVFE